MSGTSSIGRKPCVVPSPKSHLPNVWDVLLLLVIMLGGVIYLSLAMNLPTSLAPDESMRNDIAYWIFENHSLPVGDEAELLNNSYGFSYATFPLLPPILSAIVMWGASLFTKNPNLIWTACRIPSVLATMGSIFFCYQIGQLLTGKKSTGFFMALMIGFWPQVVFVSGYYNCDALSLFSDCFILYCLLNGRQNHWNTKSCLLLSVAFSVNILTYYNAYGWCLMGAAFCVWSCIQDDTIDKKARFILKRTLLIFCVVGLLSGWFFIRNAYLHNGDFIGMQTMRNYALAQKNAGVPIHENTPPITQGMTLSEMLNDGNWIPSTTNTFFAGFGGMNIFLSTSLYSFYKIFVVVGLILFAFMVVFQKSMRDVSLHFSLGAVCVITVMLSVWYSYSSDYQPQGRYILPILPALLVFITLGYNYLCDKVEEKVSCYVSITGYLGPKTEKNFWVTQQTMQYILIFDVIWVVVFGIVFLGTMLPELYPSQEIQTYVSSDSTFAEITFVSKQELEEVQMAVWCRGTDEDLQWLPASKCGERTWSRTVNLSTYNCRGTYNVHVYGRTEDQGFCFLEAALFNVNASVDNSFIQLIHDATENTLIIAMDPAIEYENITFFVWLIDSQQPIQVQATYDAENNIWSGKAELPDDADSLADVSVQAFEIKENEEKLFVANS